MHPNHVRHFKRKWKRENELKNNMEREKENDEIEEEDEIENENDEIENENNLISA